MDGKFNINIEEKVNEFLENNQEIKDIAAKLNINTNKIEDINTKLNTNINNIKNINLQIGNIENIKQNKGFLYDIKLDSVIDTYNLVPTDYYALFDGLIAKHPTMFGKHELGKDQSGQYPIYLYQYKPTNYKNTILVTCGVHGYENYTPYIMYLFMKNLLDSSQTPLQLSNLKNNTRILLMPVCNPWGMFQTPKTRWNSRGVDINRNFDWNWENNPVSEPFTDNYKV